MSDSADLEALRATVLDAAHMLKGDILAQALQQNADKVIKELMRLRQENATLQKAIRDCAESVRKQAVSMNYWGDIVPRQGLDYVYGLAAYLKALADGNLSQLERPPTVSDYWRPSDE